MSITVSLIDIHSHILSGIDDGAKDMETSVAMARRYVEAGFSAVVATPHFITGTAWMASPETIAAQIEHLQGRLDDEVIDLNVYGGMEIADHPRLLERLRQGKLLPLATSGHYLLEPSFHGPQHNLLHTIKSLLDTGIPVVLAHAERCSAFQRNLAPLFPLVEHGLQIQVNSASFLDGADPLTNKTAMALLAADIVHYLAADAHGMTHRPPPSQQDIQQLVDLLGQERVVRLWSTNPATLLATSVPLPPQSLA